MPPIQKKVRNTVVSALWCLHQQTSCCVWLAATWMGSLLWSVCKTLQQCGGAFFHLEVESVLEAKWATVGKGLVKWLGEGVAVWAVGIDEFDTAVAPKVTP